MLNHYANLYIYMVTFLKVIVCRLGEMSQMMHFYVFLAIYYACIDRRIA